MLQAGGIAGPEHSQAAGHVLLIGSSKTPRKNENLRVTLQKPAFPVQKASVFLKKKTFTVIFLTSEQTPPPIKQ